MLKKVLFAMLVFLPAIAFAHVTGFSIEKTSGEYIFDIGYSTEFIAGDFIRFDLSLLAASDRKIVPFGDAWVRISQGEKLLFAGPIAYGEFGKPGFSFVFPEAGDYTLSVRFEDSVKSISTESFPLQVKSGPAAKGMPPILIPIGSLVLGLIVGFIGSKLFKRHA